jgi:sec-independent protein translocase protein TatC
MFGLGTWELALILVAALIFIGPNKLPDLARNLGKGMREMRRAMAGFEREVQEASRLEDPKPADAAAAKASDVATAASAGQPGAPPPEGACRARGSHLADRRSYARRDQRGPRRGVRGRVSDSGVMSFREHLAELRSRLIRIAAIVTVGFFVCWSWRIELFGFLSGPIARALADNGVYHFQAIEITESIMVYVKTSVVAAAVLTSPLTFWQLWSFISPGLLQNERRFIIPVTAFTVIFFLIGCAFSYEVILPFITDWLVKLTLEGGQADVVVTLQNAYSTSFVFLLIFGAVFELPLVIFFLALFGIVTHKSLVGFFRYFVVISFIVGGILTPPDPLSQILMAVPLNVLYAFGILVAWGVDRSRGEDGRPTAGRRHAHSHLRCLAAARRPRHLLGGRLRPKSARERAQHTAAHRGLLVCRRQPRRHRRRPPADG